MAHLKFTIHQTDPHSKARCGTIETAHGDIQTPVFMPVGTRGAVKTLTTAQVLELDPKIILGNTYHLMLKPGKEIIQKGGGLHAFMRWPRAILTDSGGFQVFSLSKLRKMTEEGVRFRSHIDGRECFLGPEESMEVQRILGSDIAMCFDECAPYPCTREEMEASLERTHRWARRCRDYAMQEHQNVFGIVQGGVFSDLRKRSAEALVPMDFEGYAIGGLSVGEPAAMMYEAIAATEPLLPPEKPRYLMGVGTPRNIIEAVMRGIDMFDCVMPTRNARNGTAFTWQGKVNIKAGRYADDFSLFDPELDCDASRYSKAYVRHLLNVDEITGLTLVTQQNLAFYLDFMKQMREAIASGTLTEFHARVSALYPE